jgi:hypothetical protein
MKDSKLDLRYKDKREDNNEETVSFKITSLSESTSNNNNNNNVDIDYNDNNNNEKSKSKKEKIRSILQSHRFHLIILGLICLDCCCIIGEIIIDYVDLSMLYEGSLTLVESLKEKCIENNNIPTHLNGSMVINHENNSSMTHQILVILEDIFKFGSITILGIFFIEIIFKVAFIPKVFIENKLEIVDGN